MMKRLIGILLFCFQLMTASAQSLPDTAWTRCYGGSQDDWGVFIEQTFDGGYILLGRSHSNDGDLLNGPPGAKTWILKLDSIGNFEWETFDHISGDYARNIFQTSDSGYVYGGSHTYKKLDKLGNQIWSDSVTTSYIIQSGEGEYALVGGTTLMKLDSFFNTQWITYYGDNLQTIHQTSDGGFVVASSSAVDYAPDAHEFAKFDQNGNFEYAKNVGGGLVQEKITTIQTLDNKFISIGKGQDFSSTTGYLRKGNEIQDWALHTPDHYPRDIMQRHDTSFLFCGTDTAGNAILSRVTPMGVEIATGYFGGSSYDDRLEIIVPTRDSGYIAIGTTSSNDGYIWNNHGGSDIWVLKFKPDTFNYATPEPAKVTGSLLKETSVYPSESKGIVYINLPDQSATPETELYDLSGHKLNIVRGRSAQLYTVKMDQLPPGQYILSVMVGQEQRSFRINYVP